MIATNTSGYGYEAAGTVLAAVEAVVGIWDLFERYVARSGRVPAGRRSQRRVEIGEVGAHRASSSQQRGHRAEPSSALQTERWPHRWQGSSLPPRFAVLGQSSGTPKASHSHERGPCSLDGAGGARPSRTY